MLKRVLMSTSALALATGIAFAQTQTSRGMMSGRSVGMPASSLSTTPWLASDIYKAIVYDDSEHKIGDVTDLASDSNGNVTTAIIDVNGFLGVGQKDIAVPFKELKLSSRNGRVWLTLKMTQDELMKARAFGPKGCLDSRDSTGETQRPEGVTSFPKSSFIFRMSW